MKSVFLKISYGTPVNLSFLVERSSNTTPAAVNLNLGVSADSELKAHQSFRRGLRDEAC